MKKKDMAQLIELNELEIFLKEFMDRYPEYQTLLIGISKNKEADYERLMYVMKNVWHKKYPNRPFFLDGSSLNLEEDFFIPQDENVAIQQNLRYMPLILHSHQFIELNYIVKSNGSAMITSDTRQMLQDGDIILCPPGLNHCFDTQDDLSIIIDILIRVTTFDTAFFNLLSNNSMLSSAFSNVLYNPGNAYIMWHCKDDTLLYNLISSIYEEANSSEMYKAQMTEILVMQFILQLMRRHEQQTVFSQAAILTSDEQFQSMLNYMHTHCQALTLPALAAHYNYSERQMIRLLKKHTGKGFSELLLDIRMKKAIQLLKNPDIPIRQIASGLGYSNYSYFVKVFKKTLTFTPEDFRKRMAEDTIFIQP